MKISAMIWRAPEGGPHATLVSRIADYARRIETAGFAGIWGGDSLGRSRDPLIELAALAAVAERVELGVGVLQVPCAGHRTCSSRAVGAGLVGRSLAARGRQWRDA